MVQLGLDDTLHAIVQVTHEHGLPLFGVNAGAGRVQVFIDVVDLRWWVRWVTDPVVVDARFTVWQKGSEVAFHLCAHREGIEWSVALGVPSPAAAVLAAHGVTVTEDHRAVPAVVAVALAEACADDADAGTGCGQRVA